LSDGGGFSGAPPIASIQLAGEVLSVGRLPNGQGG